MELFRIKVGGLNSRDQSRLSRCVQIFEICRDAVEKSWHCRGLKSQRIEKSRRENTKIHALLGRDQDKLSRNAKNFRSRRISRSWSRLFGLDIDVEARFLNCRDALFENVKIFSTDKTNSLTVSRSRLSIGTWSRHIETPRLSVSA